MWVKYLEMLRDLTDRRIRAILLSMMTFQQLMVAFPTEDACKDFLFFRRWADGKPRCPRCGKSETVYNIAQAWKWECSNPECRSGNAYRFSLTAGTIFENTKVPLLTWFKVLYTMLQSKKGVSSRQIRRMFFGETSSLHTAWYICHRLRAAMHDPDFKQLMGIVEVDETYIGGKQGNRHAKDRAKYSGRGAANTGKTTVIGAIARKGNVVCKVIEDTDARTLSRFVRTTVADRVSLVATDEHGGYAWLKPMKIPHQSVNHREGEYVRGEVHTNNIESFWSLFKRGVIGTYHNVSKKYLPLYLAEFQFRHNNRKNPDIFGEAIGGC
jgi:transposase-like protein